MRDSQQGSVVLDLRCLQDPNYQRRGIGRHALAMLRHAPRGRRLVGLTDPALPALPLEAQEAVDEIHPNAYASSWSATPRHPPACFVTMSPMTHDPLFAARLLSDVTLLRAAIVYDFIPRRLPERYLPSAAEQLSYAAAMRWLARCDVFLPISRSSADDLKALLGVPESAIAVTGCPLEPAFETLTELAFDRSPRHLLLVGGADARKNPETVIRAHARSPAMQGGAGVPLVVAGNYGEVDAEAFRTIARDAGGRPGLIEVPGHVSDSLLFDLYVRAVAVVTASYDEGFSIPVIEGMAAGVPCLASDIPAHAELVTDPDCRFPAGDDAALCSKLQRLVTDPAWRSAILERQVQVWPRFKHQAVARRFWAALSARPAHCQAGRPHRRRPRVALLSPLPPDRSGVADYTAATCAEFGKLVDLHLFTETERPSPLPNVASVRPLSAFPCLTARFDRVVHVIGNSGFHSRIFEMLLRYGGACIAHDARMLGFYRVLLGQERALSVASKELGRSVTDAELNAWLADEGKLEALFLGEITEAAAPLIVHSPVTQGLLREKYGSTSTYLPFSIYRPWRTEELTPERRAAARRRLDLRAGEVAVVTFGFVHASKAPEECIWALETLRGWAVPATLHFVGGLGSHGEADKLHTLVATLGLQPYVHFVDGYVPEERYRDYLLAADLAVQLRTYGLGGLSGALLDCAAAGVPTVTNASLGAAVGVPPYVRCIPDAISPLLLAEALANLLEADLAAKRPEQARLAYSEARSLAAYAHSLCRALDLDVAT